VEFLYVLLGIAIGVIITLVIYKLRTVHGVLRIDHSNLEKDIYRFEVDNLDALSRKKYIVLEVDNYAELSQE